MRSQFYTLIFTTMLVAFLVVGCGWNEVNAGTPLADPVLPTELPPALNPDLALCDGLASTFSGAFQAEMLTTTAPFQDVVSGQTVDGCTGTLSVPSENIASLGDAISLTDALMKTNGWMEDMNYSAGGAGGIMNGYRLNDSICMVITEIAPIEDTLCSSDEPFAVCMDRLTEDEKIYKVTLNCADVPGSSKGPIGLPQAGPPAVLPPAFDDELVQSLVSTEIPPMIPSTFMIADEMALYPTVLSMEMGLYEVGIDFGEDCNGATACHFGVLGGSLTSGNELFSTQNIFVDVDRAVPVTLANGIEGYYIEGLCGASCSDSLIVWVQDFYQYIIGSKGASQAYLLDLVNSAISNQAP